MNDSAKTKIVDQGKPAGLGAQKLSSLSEDAVPWLETSAEVIGCRYRFAGMSVLVFGIDTDHDHFMVSFSYYAHAQTFYDECASSKAMARGETFPIFYNPTNPKENNRFNLNTKSKVPLVVVAILGSFVISFVYLASWVLFHA